jgi:hypothetical protein
MNRKQKLVLLVAVVNLTLILLFPPFDYVSLAQNGVATFGGFRFVFGDHGNLVLNQNFLILEVIVVLINTSIAFLVTRVDSGQPAKIAGNRNQRYLLAGMALNLVVMLLFPPFENSMAITKAVIPTLEGFYFVFGDNSQRQLVAPILYLEITLILVNGGLFWLMLKDRTDRALTSSDLRKLANTVRSVRKP